jgi:iron complex transport system substrate-binding protein
MITSLEQKLKQEIDSRAMEHGLEIVTLTNLLGVSRSHAIRCFKKKYKISPWQYCKYVRISKAKLLLLDNFFVKEVADMTGFRSIYHFSRIFKQVVGQSPSQFALRGKQLENIQQCDH